MSRKFTVIVLAAFVLYSCKKHDYPGHNPYENAADFSEISSITVGGEGAAEISAFDPLTKKLFVITNASDITRIDVVDLANPATPVAIGIIDISVYGGNVNSVDVKDGKLAAAVEGYTKSAPGKVLIFSTLDHSLIKEVGVGAQPDMLVYSPDGKYILTANEGEPETDYSADPVGSISVIAVDKNYSVVTTDFSGFAGQYNSLKLQGFRVFGPGTFAQSVEPEYITVSQDSKTAWVTLQENNAIAKIDIRNGSISQIFPLGFKDYSIGDRIIDPSDDNKLYTPAPWTVKGMYQPDAIAVVENNGIPYLFTANEGDVREWDAFAENERVKDIVLDAGKFPDFANLQKNGQLGRLNITTTLGDTDGDNDYDELYSFGARSFSVWNGNSGSQVYDSKNELETKTAAAGFYDDGRSDDKGVEPEGIAVGVVGRKGVAVVGMERADALAIYDITNPSRPVFIKLLKTGDAPEGIMLISSSDSPTGKSLLVVSSENDGTVKIYQP